MAKLTRQQFVERIQSIKLLAIDVDGVLTDDTIFFGPDGAEFKKFNVSDGFYMVMAMRHGWELAIVSGRYSAATESRMKDLGVKHVLQARKDKVEMIKPLLTELEIGFEEVAFIGNEILDITLARKVGLSIGVADSVRDLLDEVDYVTAKPGGCGAVREVIECYFEAIGFDPKELVT